MQQAYDTLFQEVIGADKAAKNRMDEPFRYECLCCGEEVYVAAAKSKKRTVHFRHRRGNSDRDCELYLGNKGITGALVAAKKRSHCRTEIYYDVEQKIFRIGVLFSNEKLDEYEKKGSKLILRTARFGDPYENLKINRQNFSSESMVYIPLKLASNECYLEITEDNYIVHLNILNEEEFPTFFRLSSNEQSANMAKRIIGGKLYTDTRYYVVAKDKAYISKIAQYRYCIKVGKIEAIKTMGEEWFGALVEINSSDGELKGLFDYFNYELMTTEILVPLWPPMSMAEGEYQMDGNRAYLRTSFELKPNSNISCEEKNISNVDGIFEVDITDIVRIHYENVDICIRQQKLIISTDIKPCEHVLCKKIDIDMPASYFLVNNEGYIMLQPGGYSLNKKDMIIKYENTYPVIQYTYPNTPRRTGVYVLQDVLSCYKVTLPFDEKMVEGMKLSVIAQSYIEECRIEKKINKKVLELIKTGVI